MKKDSMTNSVEYVIVLGLRGSRVKAICHFNSVSALPVRVLALV